MSIMRFGMAMALGLVTTSMADVDALNGAGLFVANGSATGWTSNVYKYSGYSADYTGNVKGEVNNDDNYVLGFWSNGRDNIDWHIQATHSITLTKGYSYQIEGDGYYYDGSSGEISVGLQGDGEDPEVYVFDDVEPDLFTGKVYNHCRATDNTAKLVINGGSIVGTQVDSNDPPSYTSGGGFAIQNIRVMKTAIDCDNPTTTSSSSVSLTSSASQPSSSATQLNGKRIGPVSQYGQLQTGKNSSGWGRIYGSCPAYQTSGKEVQVKGMSLFWSIDANAAKFWTRTTIEGLVQQHNIQLIRAAMGVDEEWGAKNYFSNTDYYAGLMDTVVQTAIDNDIYVIIDYHSHKANYHVNDAKSFFTRMAQKWGAYDNVIFEIFNEPYCERDNNDNCKEILGQTQMLNWSTIKTYANEIIKTIRTYSDNLIVVGTRSWDQHPEDAINKEVTDSKNNTAYALHYYASSHGEWLRSNGDKAMKAGLSLFVSEWGTIYASGRGEVFADSNAKWQTWMNNNMLSSANWSVGNKVEGKYEDDSTYVGGDGQGGSYFAANFLPSSSNETWSYSTSGKWINANYLAGLPTTYTACNNGNTEPEESSSSEEVPSAASSSSKAVDPPASSSSATIPPPASSSSKVVDPPAGSSSAVAPESSGEAEPESSGEVPAASSSSAVAPATSSAETPASSSSKKVEPPASSSSEEDITFIAAQAARAGYTIARQDNTLQIFCPSGKTFKVEVFDMMGNTITRQNASGSLSLPLSNMLSGTYLVRISGKAGTMTTKVNVK